MKSIIVMALIIILTIVLLTFGLSLLAKVFSNFQPGKNKVRKDLRKMKTDIQPWINDLVPWDRNEMELLSSNQINRVDKKGVVRNIKGVFTSIYHEPMVAYSMKKYVSPNENAVLYAKTSQHEFVYRILKNETEIFIDNHKIGILDKKGKLYNVRGNQLLGEIKKDSETLLLPVEVKGKEVGSIINEEESGKANQRAFNMLANSIDDEEEAVFLSLAVLELVERSVT